MPDRKLRVFLCHASQDKPIVRELYQRLLAEDWIDPWLDEEKLLPGQDWSEEIRNAILLADNVVVCLSNASITKEGFVRKELNISLELVLEKLDNAIFIIPLRLENCVVPKKLAGFQWCDYFPKENRNRAYERLMGSFRLRAKILNLKLPPKAEAQDSMEKIRREQEILREKQLMDIQLEILRKKPQMEYEMTMKKLDVLKSAVEALIQSQITPGYPINDKNNLIVKFLEAISETQADLDQSIKNLPPSDEIPNA